MKKITKLSEIYIDDIEFEYQYNVFKKDTWTKTFLNSIFCCDIKVTYISDGINYDKNKMDWSGATIIFLNSKGKWCTMSNSEWAWLNKDVK